MRKAVALLSGGLDSMLAVKLMLEQDIYVEGINFFTGFCVEGHTHSIRNRKRTTPLRNNALWAAEQLGIKLHIIDVIEPYKQVVLKPRHGYGANLNPCLDCKTFMVARAREWMEQNQFDFIVTGEVLGQRPRSQLSRDFPVVASESGIGGHLLRPLSAKLLPETLPERKGWVDRERLHEFSGRGRRYQMELAKQYNFVGYSQPAGGCCFLTDQYYTRKMRDLWAHRGTKTYEFDDIMLLKVGRHLRPKPEWKIIVARDAGETEYLNGYRNRYPHIAITSHSGPVSIIDGHIANDDIVIAARLATRFGSAKNAVKVDVLYSEPGGKSLALSVKPMKPQDIPKPWYV